MRLSLAAFFLGLALVPSPTTARAPENRPAVRSDSLVSLRVGRGALDIEVASTPQARTQGLSGRTHLDWNRGMLFVFPDSDQRIFWMIDCTLDLDIAFLAADGTVRDIQTMRAEPGVPPERLARYPSATSDIRYALEVNRGWLAANGVRVGQKIPQVALWKTRI